MRRGSALWFMASCLLASSARADLDSLGGTKPGDLPFPSFEDADGCATCHGGGFAGDTTYLPSDSWAGTMMANAARDPVFFAALTVANQDVPGVGTYCLRCHSPIAFVRGDATPADGSAFDAIDRQGVGCDTCHRMTHAPMGGAPYLLGDAQIFYDDKTDKRGPYDPSLVPAHGSTKDDGFDDARLCGQCHQVTNPLAHLKDAAGVDTGLDFPLDTTFAEWAASDFAKAGAQRKTCTDCHMTAKAGMLPVATPQGSPLRDDARAHAFVGGNAWGVRAVMAAEPARAQKLSKAFALAEEATQKTLEAAVVVTFEALPKTLEPGAMTALRVRVQNETGHKFPTGYAESRRAWLAVVLVDEGGQETVLAGAYDEAKGTVAQGSRVYRAEHGSFEGGQAKADGHLALHDAIVSDTRIPPRGFVADLTTTPRGDVDFADGHGGFRSFDDATLTVALPSPLPEKSYTLSARVLYQPMTREHVELLASANTTDQRGQELAGIYAKDPAPPVVVARADAVLDVKHGSGSGGAGGLGGSTSVSAASSSATSSSAGGADASAVGSGCYEGAGAAEPGAGSALTALTLLLAARRRRSRYCSRKPSAG